MVAVVAVVFDVVILAVVVVTVVVVFMFIIRLNSSNINWLVYSQSGCFFGISILAGVPESLTDLTPVQQLSRDNKRGVDSTIPVHH